MATITVGIMTLDGHSFNPSFEVQGELHHRMGSLLPAGGQSPKFAKIYFYDTHHELQTRLPHFDSLKADTLFLLQNHLHDISSYCSSVAAAVDTWEHTKDIRFILDLKKKPSGAHCRQYNVPIGSELSAPNPNERWGNLDVFLHNNDGSTGRISTPMTLHSTLCPVISVWYKRLKYRL